MRTQHATPLLSVGFISLGCAKNLVDSQVMADRLLAGGLRLAPSPEQADVVVVNTCAFIAAAREESADSIRYACGLKAAGPCRAVIVAGCLPQRYAGSVAQEFPGVDAFIGLDRLDDVASVARAVTGGASGILNVSPAAARLYEPGRSGVVFTGGPYAYLKIAEGCNHRCAFCAIPGIRGRYRSRPVASLVREAERLLEHGFRELNLVSQDTTMYGRDLGGAADLAALLRALSRFGGAYWVRLLYAYPSRVTPRLLETMAELGPVCPYVDVPIQHSHPDVLQAMRRGGTAAAVGGLADRIRAALPGAAVRTTCLVGFPGETAGHFRHLLEHVRAARFDHLGVFTYSPEEGTAAARLGARPAARAAERRRTRLMLAQLEVARGLGAARVGRQAVVLLERGLAGRPGVWVGRSPGQAPEVDGVTVVRGVPGGRRAGDFVTARYTGHADYDMQAEFVP